MLCIRPFRLRPGLEFGCGQCLPCRINRRRQWTARIVLEAASWGDTPSAFVTLTYRPQDLPVGGFLVPLHVEQFRYRLRHRIGPFRYYFVGEYGERSGRPHYHGLLFGVVPTEKQLLGAWPFGSIHVGFCTPASAAYCAGYVTKRQTAIEASGKPREFARMSLKPGIGVPGLHGIIQWLYTDQGAAYLARARDVPQCVRFEGKIFPLGRYLVKRLRQEFGIPDHDFQRDMVKEARRLENTVPDVMVAREFRREGNYQRAYFYKNLRESKEII